MNWRFKEDTSPPIITAAGHANSNHRKKGCDRLPETCVMFEFRKGMETLSKVFETEILTKELPCFLQKTTCLKVKENDKVCFTKGGYGAPAAVDTLETVIALGVKCVVIVGLCGIFEKSLSVGDIILPQRILSEEGTSRHYYESIDFVIPDSELLNKAERFLKQSGIAVHQQSTVSSDSIYRQTFKKEAYWREQGCVGVDMEASAILAVCQYYGIKAVVMLMASDKHPQLENEPGWKWGELNFETLIDDYIVQAIQFALDLTK